MSDLRNSQTLDPSPDTGNQPLVDPGNPKEPDSNQVQPSLPKTPAEGDQTSLMLPAIEDKQPETKEKPIHFTCKEAIEYIKGLKVDEENQPQVIEGAHIGQYSLITQSENYAVYRNDQGYITIEVVDIENKKLIQTIKLKDKSSEENEKFHNVYDRFSQIKNL